MKELGYNHIPKGNRAKSGDGFNKSNDFVTLYRGDYGLEQGGQLNVINFSTLDETKLSYLPDDAGISYHTETPWGTDNNIEVRFLDRAKFKWILNQGLNPGNVVQDFLDKYDGIMEIDVKDKDGNGMLMLHYEIEFTAGNGTGDALFETVSIRDRYDHKTIEVVKREQLTYGNFINGVTTTAENIQYFRVQQNGMPAPFRLKLNTYEDLFIKLQNGQLWEAVGNFALSDDEEEVFTWFQGNPYLGGSLNLQWPKYNDGVMLVPDNYYDRWDINLQDGLKKTIRDFIALSDTDSRANKNYFSDDVDNDMQNLTVSLLDMLKLIGIDYHAARMMGLGYLDEYPDKNNQPFVYAAVYTTIAELPVIGTDNTHVFITLPTITSDYRLPAKPDIDISYGLNVSTDENNPPEPMSGPDGYSFYEDVRFVNLIKKSAIEPQEVLNYIPGNNNDFFDATQITRPAGYGIEYKQQNEKEWRQPELLHDDDYYDANGIKETITTPERGENPIYTHRETEYGVHLYALYAVNWFSRTSSVSIEAATDATVFPKRNTLLPPVNFRVQYIQEEDPTIFTTSVEQEVLYQENEAHPGEDNCKTRVTFDWDDVHNNAYQSANKIQFFFRANAIKKVEGRIKSVIDDPLNNKQSVIATESFLMASASPAVIISPTILPGEVAAFTGSMLNTQEGQFEIVSIAQSAAPGSGPLFTVKKITGSEAVQATVDDPIIAMPVYTAPKADDVFFIFENVTASNGWDQLSQTLTIVNFSNLTEVVYEDDGSFHNERVDGINGTTNIQVIKDSNNIPTGGYIVSFLNTILQPHPDAAVTWSKGSARLILNARPQIKKKLPVVAIQQTNPLTMIVFDADYFTIPGERIKTGNSITVNFHPSYKIYLSPQAGVFDRTTIMPQGNSNNKKTYLAARSADSSVSNYSSLTPAAVLVARNVQKPLKPELISGPSFATRPDFYRKSTYTLDIQLNTNGRTPFGLIAYRANEMSILQALYKPETLVQVVAELKAIANMDPYKYARWKSLIEVEREAGSNNQFKLFAPYRFPNPDNDGTAYFRDAIDFYYPFPLRSNQTLETETSVIKKVIEDVFSSLTETPVVFEYLQTGYQTSPQKPVTKSVIGKWLFPGDSAFNPFPMAVKYPSPNPNTVRLTDYTLSGNARNIYFYFAREIALDGKLSERTSVSGPVVLVDATPAEKPTIRSIITQEANPVMTSSAAIRFNLAAYIESENITQYQIFRATNVADAATVRTMQLAATIAAGDPVEDSFAGLPSPPFGQSLFYRIVALRKIVNELGNVEMIPSQPSEMMLTNIIDVLNPAAPDIEYNNLGVSAGPNGEIYALLNVSLSWPQTVYNGTYYVYKMNDKGNWEKLWSKKTNDLLITFPENGDFTNYPQMENILKIDDDGNAIYHRFKVAVENANGLFNLEDKELII